MTTRTLNRGMALRASPCCQVVCAVIAGVALGHYYPALGRENEASGKRVHQDDQDDHHANRL